TINKVCGSGLKAVALAAQAVELGESEIVVAGGMESMSNCPYLLLQARTGYRLGDGKLVDSMINDGLWDGYENFHMGMTGEVVAEKYRLLMAFNGEAVLLLARDAVRFGDDFAGHAHVNVLIPVPQSVVAPGVDTVSI